MEIFITSCWGENREKGYIRSNLHLGIYAIPSTSPACRVVAVRTPADQHGGIPAHQTKGEPLEEVFFSLPLLLTSVSGKCSSQHLDLGHCDLVQTPQGFHGKRDEGKTLLSAGFGSSLHFPGVGFLQRSSSVGCCPGHMAGGKGAGDRDIKGRIFAIGPARQEDVGRASFSARQQVSAFPGWSKCSAGSRFEEDISQKVVSSNPIAILCAAQGMIAHLVTGEVAGRALTLRSIEWNPEPILEGKGKLRAA